jgi:nucleoside-diphosphate-sugar epimerase
VSHLAWSRTDLTDGPSVRSLIERVNPDVVFHLAGHVTGSQDITHVSPAFELNLASTVLMLTAAVETGRCRIVLAGSMQEPDRHDPTAVPCSPYAASKWACTGYARMFHALYQLPVIIARPFMVYGPGQWDLTKLLPYVIVSLLKGEAPRISSGTRSLDWVYVADVVDGLLLVGKSPYADARTIDLGTGELVSIRALVALVQELLGSPTDVQFGAVADRPLERPHAARIDETTRLIGWRPSTPLKDGLGETIAWYRSNVAAEAGISR